jgi:hypothetical protein
LFDIENDTGTGYAKIYQILLYFEKTIKEYISKEFLGDDLCTVPKNEHDYGRHPGAHRTPLQYKRIETLERDDQGALATPGDRWTRTTIKSQNFFPNPRR